jgi:hypothetical protein
LVLAGVIRIDSRSLQRPHGRGILLLVCALWVAALVSPGPANAQERGPATGGALAVRPWLEWAQFVDPDCATWLGSPDEQASTTSYQGITWNNSFEQREAGPHDGRTPIGWRSRASSTLWAGVLTGDVDLLAVEGPNSVGLDTEARRWLRLAVKEAWGPVTLGVRGESASPGLEGVTEGRVKTETAGAEAWVEGREGPAGLRLSGGQFRDNLANNPWQPQTTKTQGGAAADAALPVGLTLSLSYQGGVAESDPGPRPRGLATVGSSGSTFHNLTSSLSYSGQAWALTISSSYVPSRDVHDPERETRSLSHDLSATLQLPASITITPALGIAEDTYEWSGARSQTTSASVSVSRASVLEGVDLSVSGSYARSQMTGDTGATDDATAVNAAAGVVWRLRRAARVEPRLAFEVGSNYYFDKVTAAVGYAEVYGVVTLRILSF